MIQVKNYLEEDRTQNYLVFQPIFRYFEIYTTNNTTNYVLSWKSKGLSSESIKAPTTSDNSLIPTLNYYYPSKIRVEFARSCLKQDKVIFHHAKVVNVYIVYELCASTSSDTDPTIQNRLFSAVNQKCRHR